MEINSALPEAEPEIAVYPQPEPSQKVLKSLCAQSELRRAVCASLAGLVLEIVLMFWYLYGRESKDDAQAHGLLYGLLQRHSAMLALADDFWLMGIAFLAIIPLMFLMKKTKPHAGSAPLR